MFFTALYNNVYKNYAKFGHIGPPGNRRQNKKIAACIVVLYNARSVTNHIADVALLIL